MSSVKSAILLSKQALYKMRRNVGLDQAEDSKQYATFKKRVDKTISKQVKDIVETDKVIDDLIFLLNKAEAEPNLKRYLDKFWVSFGAVFNQLFGDNSLEEFYIFSANAGGQSALDRMDIQVDFKLTNDAVTQYLKERENLLIDSVDNKTKERMVLLIQEGREGLLTNFEIKQLIVERFDEISENRAETIARTELSNAFNAVEYETYKRNGVKKIRWVTVFDERVCPICDPLHNKEVDIGNNFATNITRPPGHPNCRCFIEEVIQGVSVRDNTLAWTGGAWT